MRPQAREWTAIAERIRNAMLTETERQLFASLLAASTTGELEAASMRLSTLNDSLRRQAIRVIVRRWRSLQIGGF